MPRLRDSLTAFVALRGESLEAFRAALLRAFNPAQGELFTDRPPVQVLPATHVATACAVCPECFEAYGAAFNRAVLTAYQSVTPMKDKLAPAALVMADKRKARADKRGNRPAIVGSMVGSKAHCAAPHCSREGRPSYSGGLYVCPKHRAMLGEDTLHLILSDTPEAREAIEADIGDARGEVGSLFDPREDD